MTWGDCSNTRYKWPWNTPPPPPPLLRYSSPVIYCWHPFYFKIDGLWFQHLARAVVKVNKALVCQLTLTLACGTADTDSGLWDSWHRHWLVGQLTLTLACGTADTDTGSSASWHWLVTQLTLTLACRTADTDTGLSDSWHWHWLVGQLTVTLACRTADTDTGSSDIMKPHPDMISSAVPAKLACRAQNGWNYSVRCLHLDTGLLGPVCVIWQVQTTRHKNGSTHDCLFTTFNGRLKKLNNSKSTEELPSQLFVFGFCCCFPLSTGSLVGLARHPC